MMQITAILLAAGRSRRMGALKPLLPFGETTVIRSCVEHLVSGGVDEIIVVVGHQAEDVKSHLENLNMSFVFNPDPDSEMSASISCGLQAIGPQTGAVLIMPADHPAVGPEVMRKLIEHWKAGFSLVVPEYKGHGGHPVLVDLSYRAELAQLDPLQGLRALFAAHRNQVRRVPVASRYIARDLDTWDDYCSLHEEIFGVLPPVARPPANGPILTPTPN
jgi:molybdenum cofactor cytidylyltransferase